MAEETVAKNQSDESQTTDDDQGAQADNESLDELLAKYNKEFDDGTQEKVAPKQQKKDEDWTKKFEERLSAVEAQKTQDDVLIAAKRVVDYVKDDVQIDEEIAEAMLNQMAAKDNRLMSAFENRNSDPASWDKVLKASSKKIAEKFKSFNVDKDLTDDRDAVAAAVKGSSTAKSDDGPPDFDKMSDREFDEWKRKAAHSR